MHTHRSWIAVGLACLAMGVIGLSCKSESDEDKIRKVIRRALEGANEKSASKVIDDAVPDFVGPNKANLTECRRILLGYFLRQGWLKAFERSLEITVNGETATAQLEVVLARGNPVEKIEDVVPTNAARFLFQLELAKRDGDWKFTAATYEQKRL